MASLDPRAPDRSEADQIVRVRQRAAEWYARTSWRERLFGPSAPDWFALEHEARAACVKSGYARKTWRVAVDDWAVFAKVLDGGGIVDAFKRMIGAGAGRREWRAARKAEQRGVPVARCLAVGLRKESPVRTAYLSEAVGGAVNLADAWRRDTRPRSVSQRRLAACRLIEAVARLYATAHKRGFIPRDGHANNIVVRSGLNDTSEAVFVDVHPASVTRGPTSLPRAARSLARIDQYFRRLSTGGERLRFLQRYVALRYGADHQVWRRSFERRLAVAVSRAGTVHAVKLARHRDRRLKRPGRYFSSVRLRHHWRATVTLVLERRHVFPEEEIADRTAMDWLATLDPLVKAIDEGRTDAGTNMPAELSVEASRPMSFTERVHWTLAGSPHRKAFERCHKLRHRDKPAELILGYAERRRAGLVDTTLLIRPRGRDKPGVEAVAPTRDGSHGKDRDHTR